MVLPFKGAQKHLQKGVCQNWTFTTYWKSVLALFILSESLATKRY